MSGGHAQAKPGSKKNHGGPKAAMEYAFTTLNATE
jgi:hypothetical protein